MKKLLINSLLMLLALPAQAQAPAQNLSPKPWAPVSLPHTQSFEMTSRHTGQRYQIQLALPLRVAPPAGYPVLYALDGGRTLPLLDQTMGKPSANQAHEARFTARHGQSPDGLVVAIGYASGERIDIDARALDYTPPNDCAQPCEGALKGSGGAERFLDFIDLELKPLIAREFAVDPARQTLMGHSYGGLFTLYALLQRPASFQRYLAISPSLWFADAQLMRELPDRVARLRERTPTALRLRLAVGSLEQFLPDAGPHPQAHRQMVEHPRTLARALSGLPGLQLGFEVLDGENHGSIVYRLVPQATAFAFAP